jgi:hypothetical protein
MYKEHNKLLNEQKVKISVKIFGLSNGANRIRNLLSYPTKKTQHFDSIIRYVTTLKILKPFS